MATVDPGRESDTATDFDRAGPDPRRWFALGVIAIASLMVVLDASIVNIALPSAANSLKISSLSSAQWVVTAYTLAFGGLLLLGGRIADYNGRKRTFIIGLLGFAAASGVGGAAQSAAMLYSSRAAQGAFAALLAPAALSLISMTFTEPKERATAFGVYGGVAGGGAAIGLLLGGVLTEYASWRWCLLVNIPIALPTALVATRVVGESAVSGRGSRYDIPGAVLSGAGLAALVYGCTEAAKPGVGWASARVLGLLAAAVVLLVGFVVQERRSAQPLLPLGVPGERNRGGTYLASLFFGAGLYGIFLFLTYYFQQTLGYSALKSGFAFLPFGVGIIVSAVAASQLLPRVGPRPLMAGGLLLATAGLVSLVTVGRHTGWVSHVLPSEIAMSIGAGFFFVPLNAVGLFGIAEEDSGVASALLNATQQLGGAIGVAVLSTLYATSWRSYLTGHHQAPVRTPFGDQPTPLAALHGYHTAFVVGAAAFAAALLAVVVFVNARKDDLPTEEVTAV